MNVIFLIWQNNCCWVREGQCGHEPRNILFEPRQLPLKPAITFSILLRNWELGSSGASKNSPGIERGEPYTASETENPVSSLGTERRPKRTRGKWNTQSKSEDVVVKADTTRAEYVKNLLSGFWKIASGKLRDNSNQVRRISKVNVLQLQFLFQWAIEVSTLLHICWDYNLLRPWSEAIGLPAIQWWVYQLRNKTLKTFLKVLCPHLLAKYSLQ